VRDELSGSAKLSSGAEQFAVVAFVSWKAAEYESLWKSEAVGEVESGSCADAVFHDTAFRDGPVLAFNWKDLGGMFWLFRWDEL